MHNAIFYQLLTLLQCNACDPGNFAPMSPMCMVGEGIKTLVVTAQGWEFKAEGLGGAKTGYIATTVGE